MTTLRDAESSKLVFVGKRGGGYNIQMHEYVCVLYNSITRALQSIAQGQITKSYAQIYLTESHINTIVYIYIECQNCI